MFILYIKQWYIFPQTLFYRKPEPLDPVSRNDQKGETICLFCSNNSWNSCSWQIEATNKVRTCTLDVHVYHYTSCMQNIFKCVHRIMKVSTNTKIQLNLAVLPWHLPSSLYVFMYNGSSWHVYIKYKIAKLTRILLE